MKIEDLKIGEKYWLSYRYSFSNKPTLVTIIDKSYNLVSYKRDNDQILKSIFIIDEFNKTYSEALENSLKNAKKYLVLQEKECAIISLIVKELENLIIIIEENILSLTV